MLKNKKLRKINEFWIIRVGFLKKHKYLPFFCIDRYIRKNLDFLSDFKNLPFKKNSCQKIHIKYFSHYFPKQKFIRTLKKWRSYLIPGGIIKIHTTINDEKSLEKIKNQFENLNFYIKEIDYSDINIDGTVSITAVKELNTKLNLNLIAPNKINNISLIINQNSHLFNNSTSVCIIGFFSINFKNNIRKFGVELDNICCLESIDEARRQGIKFDIIILQNYLEYKNYSAYLEIFQQIREISKPNGKILNIVPEKLNYLDCNAKHVFDKGILVKILDHFNFPFEWINLSSNLKMIQTLMVNELSFPKKRNNIKVLLMGVFSLRYTFLNNARWDSIARGFDKLGYNTKILDTVDNSFAYLIRSLKSYNPDIFFIGGKVGYQFLRTYAETLKKLKIKIVYWMWDIIKIIPFDFNGIIDYMFITSVGEIPLFKKKYNIQNVYYLPAAIMPEIIHRNQFIEEKYDVGFAGQFNRKKPFYKERAELLDLIKKHFNLKIFKNVFNNLPELYSQCKIIFGATPYFKDLELYASNREYISMAGGCCYITNYFKGLERLAENERHLLWFFNSDEMLSLLEKYITNKDLREYVKKEAEKLARKKHNYLIRIQNLLDIINGKTNDFYGFIN
ncbi:MAG: glycosyltransferase family protein [Promethearchaeota archaeon]